MSFDISAIKLSVDTSKLDEAITKLGQLQQATAKVEQEVKKQGKASKDSAEEQGKSVSKAEKLVEKLKQTYEDLSNEFTKGESAVLRYARSLGVSTEQMQVVIGYLKDIKGLSKDPFDDSIGSVRRIKREYEELTNRTNLLQKGIALTTKEAREYSKLSDEIAGKMKSQGQDPIGKDAALFSENLAKEQEKYLSYLRQVNDLKQKESPVVKSSSSVQQQAKEMDQHVLMYRKQQVELEKLNSQMDSHVAKYQANANKKTTVIKTEVEQQAQVFDQHVLMYKKREVEIDKVNQRLIANEEKSFNRRLENLAKYNSRNENLVRDSEVKTSRIDAYNLGVSGALSKLGVGSRSDLIGNPKAQAEVTRAGENAAKAWDAANRTIKSSREMAFAMRQVPMQITDIVVSLAGGQSPFQVLLQQGGQLKDLFGGVKEAAIALGKGLLDSLGSALRLLANPITALVGTIATLGIAMYQGASFTEQINKSIILMGNSAKVTYTQVYEASKVISGDLNVGLNTASDAFITMSKASNLTGNSLLAVTKNAVEFEKYGGASIKETSDMIKELSKDPLKAIEAITEKGFGFMTPAIYKNIIALLEQGKAADASKLAIEALSNSQKEATDKLKDNLGYLPTLWNNIKSAAIGAWNAMMGWGAKTPNEEVLRRLEEALPKMSALEASYAKERIAKLKAIIGDTNGRASSVEGNENQRRVMRENYETFTPKKDRDWLSIVNQAQKDQASNLRTVEETQRYLKAKAEEIFSKEKDTKEKKGKTFGVDFGVRGDYDKYMNKALEGEYKMLEAQAKLEKQGQNLLADYSLQTKEQMQQLEIKSLVLGMSAEEKFVEEAKLKALEQYQRIRERILQQMPEGATRDSTLKQAEDQYNATQALVTNQAKLYYQNMESFSTGWDKTYEKYKQDTMTAASFAEKAFTKMADGMTDALMQFVTTGKISFKDFTSSILADILRIQIRSQVTGLLGDSKGSIGSLVSGFAGLLGIGASSSSAPDVMPSVGTDAWNSAYTSLFANGGVFTNSIVNQPTMFKFANGGKFGLMGEAGPEAVMPLSRDSSGRLGVSMQGSSSGDVQVIINNTGTNSVVTDQREVTDSRGNRRIELTLADAVASEAARPGSSMYNATRNSFGLRPALVSR